MTAPNATGARPARTQPGLTDTSKSPYVRMRSVGLNEVSWGKGFWGERFAVVKEAMLPTMWEIMRGTHHSHFVENLRIAAGLSEGKHRGAPWNDGDLYKWMEGAAAVYALTRDEAIDRTLDELIELIGKVQRADGYIHTPVLIAQRQGRDVKPFEDRANFEMYNMGHLMTAACVHHRATGKTNFLEIARRTADFLYGYFKELTPEKARHTICPSHYMGIIEMYRTTGDPRYLELGKIFIEMRDLIEGGGDDNQDRIPFRQQTEAVGHAVRANYLYAGVADVYSETGDVTLLQTLETLWENLVTKKMYVNGACGALYDGASPDGSPDQHTITRVHQAYGRNYQLPQTTAHNETCASIGNVLWNWRMLQITGEARFADVLELALYSAVLAGASLDGRRFFYTNTLRQLDELPTVLRWPKSRAEFISCFCCPPNLLRTVAEANNYAYGRSAEGIWVNLYGGSTLNTALDDGTPVRLVQETAYPWEGSVEIQIDADAEFSLFLRIPGWANAARVHVNDLEWQGDARPGSYAEIRRKWAPGDRVRLEIPLDVRLLMAHPLVEEAAGQVAVQRGPIVYCLESVDLPEGVRVLDVILPEGVKLTPRFDPGLLGGVVVLEGKALAKAGVDWRGKLYQEVSERPVQEIDLKLIPYYAWDNRGKSEMTVWIRYAG